MFGLFKKKELVFEDLDYFEKHRAKREWEDSYNSHLTDRINNLLNAIKEGHNYRLLLEKELEMYKSLISNLNIHIKDN